MNATEETKPALRLVPVSTELEMADEAVRSWEDTANKAVDRAFAAEEKLEALQAKLTLARNLFIGAVAGLAICAVAAGLLYWVTVEQLMRVP